MLLTVRVEVLLLQLVNDILFDLLLVVNHVALAHLGL